MRTKKIRIGNDIRLAVDLRQFVRKETNPLYERCVYKPGDAQGFYQLDQNIDENGNPTTEGNEFVDKDTEVYYPNRESEAPSSCESEHAGNPVSIRAVKAILVNTTHRRAYDKALEKKSRFVARFPIEPYAECYEPTEYSVCTSGCPSYRAFPRRYRTIPYGGFGLHPEFGGLYKKLPKPMDFEYVAQVLSTSEQNIVEVSFPAEHQLHTGVYSLIIVAKVYAPGYNKENLKTITADIPNVFELVDNLQAGIDTGITIKVNQIIDNLSNRKPQGVTADDVYVDAASYTDNKILLARTDGENIDVDLSGSTGWYIEPDKD